MTRRLKRRYLLWSALGALFLRLGYWYVSRTPQRTINYFTDCSDYSGDPWRYGE